MPHQIRLICFDPNSKMPFEHSDKRRVARLEKLFFFPCITTQKKKQLKTTKLFVVLCNFIHFEEFQLNEQMQSEREKAYIRK